MTVQGRVAVHRVEWMVHMVDGAYGSGLEGAYGRVVVQLDVGQWADSY